MATQRINDTPERLFVAVRPPRSVTDLLSAIPRPAAPGVRWVEPAQWHLTLRFLPLARPGAVMAALDRLDLAQTVVTLGPAISSFGERIVMIPADGLDDLAAQILAVTSTLGPVDHRPFRGHLTLARISNGAECPLLGRPFATSFTATTVDLVASQTTQQGAIHRRLRTWMLTPSPDQTASEPPASDRPSRPG